MIKEDHQTVTAMRVYGGGFVKALSVAAQCADEKNLQKIKDTWPEYWSQYKEMSKNLPTD